MTQADIHLPETSRDQSPWTLRTLADAPRHDARQHGVQGMVADRYQIGGQESSS
jgi:hypothetical protein